MFSHIHTYIHVLLKNLKNKNFVDNNGDNYGTREYIDAGLLSGVSKNIDGGSI